jgi:hypothetical protein
MSYIGVKRGLSREEQIFRTSGNKVLRRIFRPMQKDRAWKKLHNEELHKEYFGLCKRTEHGENYITWNFTNGTIS